MKPGEHPEFFRFAPPDGRSRESTIVLDKRGRFFHDGDPIEKSSMQRAFAGWIRRHPDDGRFILENGYDWTYLTVEDTPFFVASLVLEPQDSDEVESVQVTLTDGSRESLDPTSLSLDEEGVVVCRVRGGAYEARFQPAAQAALGPVLQELPTGGFGVRIDSAVHRLPPRTKKRRA